MYVTPRFDEAAVLLILLCGAGAVAAGQWARRLCINESLTTGTVFPYVGAKRRRLVQAHVLLALTPASQSGLYRTALACLC